MLAAKKVEMNRILHTKVLEKQNEDWKLGKLIEMVREEKMIKRD